MNDNYIREIKIYWDQIDEYSYLREIPALMDLKALEFPNRITFFAGENGSGKSTLLEALAVSYGFNPEGGTLNYRFSTYDDYSELWSAARITKGYRRPSAGYFFRAESFFNVATKAIDYADGSGGVDYHGLSHGESFLEFMQGTGREGLFLMDEPEAALSPQRQLTLLIHIIMMAEKGSQFIIVTHSPILLGIPGAQILEFGDSGIRPCAYEDTESYQITKLFLENRKLVLDELLK